MEIYWEAILATQGTTFKKNLEIISYSRILPLVLLNFLKLVLIVNRGLQMTREICQASEP